MSSIIDILAILSIIAFSFIVGFHFGWNQCSKFNKLNDEK